MAGKADATLQGWVFPVAMYDNNLAFVSLGDKYGALGEKIYFIIRCLICADCGYYTQLTDILLITINRKLGRWGKGVEFIAEVIEYCGQVELFDSQLLRGQNVLTSCDIQEMWLKAKKRSKSQDNSSYWLLTNDNWLSHEKAEDCSKNANVCNKDYQHCNKNDDISYKTSKINKYIQNIEYLSREELLIRVYDRLKSQIDICPQSTIDSITRIINYMIDARYSDTASTFNCGVMHGNDWQELLLSLDIEKIVTAINRAERNADVRDKNIYVVGILVNQYKETKK